MRRRDIRIALSDACEAADAIGRFVDGRSFEDFLANPLLAAAVERKFEIVGEALNRALAIDPDIERLLPAVREAIGMRNALAHDYDDVDASTLWSTALHDLPGLAEALRRVLDEIGPA